MSVPGEGLERLPDHIWLDRIKFPWELSNFISKPKINPSDLVQIEKLASEILDAANRRFQFLQTPPMKYFGILNPAHKNLFVISSNINEAVLEALFSHLVAEQFSNVLFIVNGRPFGHNFEKATIQWVGLVKDFIINLKTEPDNRTDKQLFTAFQAAIDLNPHKILIGLDQHSNTTNEQLSLIRDKLVGSMMNLTVTNLWNSERFRDIAERIIKLNMNPFNIIIDNGSSRSIEYANERRVEAQRFLQFVRAVRAGKVGTQLLTVDQPTVEILQFHQPDSRLNTSVFDWIRLNGIKAQGLNIWNQLDVVSSRESTYIAVLDKEVKSRAMKQTPGLLDVEFPGGKTKLIHYDEGRMNYILNSLGRLDRSLKTVQSSLVQRGIGFAPRAAMSFLIQLNNQTFEFVKRILATSAFDMRSITFIISNRKSDEESAIPIELSACNDDREKYTDEIQDVFQKMKFLLDWAEADMLPLAMKRASKIANDRRTGLSILFTNFSARTGPLFEIIRDSDSLMKIDLIRVGTYNGSNIDESFLKQCYQSNGIHVDIHMGEQIVIRHSSDMELIQNESLKVEDYARKLSEIKKSYENKFGKKEEHTPITQPEINTKSCPKPDVWIPTRDTLLTIQRKNRFEYGQRPATSGNSPVAWYPPSSLARPPPVNNVYPAPPKTSVKLIQNRPKAKSNSFYLYDHGKDKAQVVHLTSSCKPPPIIPSGLKIVPSESLDRSADWLKRNGLKGLKINLERWERRVTSGSKVYRGVLPMVRNRHCELQSHELQDLEVLSLEAAKRYLKRIKWYLSNSYRLWFQSCLAEVTNQNTVVIIDSSDSSKSWLYESISAIRSMASHATGRLNFIQFNDGLKVWQDQMYSMNSQARDDLSLWLQCIRPYGGSSRLIDSIRRAFLYSPRHIIVITDGMTDMKSSNLHSELLSANDQKQIPLHFIVPSQKYKEPGFELLGYTSHQKQILETVKVLKKISKTFSGTLCIPPSPSSIDLALNRIGHSQYTNDDQHFSPAVFKDCIEISLLMKEMRKAQNNASKCRQWINAAL